MISSTLKKSVAAIAPQWAFRNVFHDIPFFKEPVSTDRFDFDRESTTLLIGESQTLPIELFAQSSIRILEMLDRVLLVLIYPSSGDHYQRLERQSVHRLHPRPNGSRKLGKTDDRGRPPSLGNAMVLVRPTFRTVRRTYRLRSASEI